MAKCMFHLNKLLYSGTPSYDHRDLVITTNPFIRLPPYYDHILSTQTWKSLRPGSDSCAEPNWIRSDFGATLARQPIQTAYRVLILTFISWAEKEKSLGPIPYFSAVIDFLFVEDLSSCFCRPFFARFIWIIIFDLFFVLFHYLSETWLTICDWTARFPAF